MAAAATIGHFDNSYLFIPSCARVERNYRQHAEDAESRGERAQLLNGYEGELRTFSAAIFLA